MSTKAVKKKSASQPGEDEAEGLWVDSALISRLHGRRSSLALPVLDADSNRLLHYADVVLGTDQKEKFVFSIPIKTREKK